jgi:hypothetical protein
MAELFKSNSELMLGFHHPSAMRVIAISNEHFTPQ